VADLRPREERGQLLLIAAFIIAVSFVVLALVVNSAIFTENLATRDDVAGSGEALEYRHEVEQSVGGMITDINENNTIDTSDQKAELRANVGHINTQGALQQTTQGNIVEVDKSSTTIKKGVKVAQDTPRHFSNTSDGSGFSPTKKDWVVVEDVERTRNLKLNVTNPSALDDSLTSDPFELEIENSTASWNMTIIYNGLASPSVATVVVESPNNGSPESCVRESINYPEIDNYIEIDVTGGTVAGDPCHALIRKTDGTKLWFDLKNDYDIKFNNFRNIEGTYSFIIDGSSLDFDDKNFGDEGLSNPDNDEHDPYYREAIYSATVPFSYHTAVVGYEADIRVAPGEVPP